MFHNSVNKVRQELTDSRQDWKKGQDLLGQAIGTLSQDLADFQKHMSTVQNKLQSQVYLHEEQERASKDKLSRLEHQFGGMQQNLYSTANEVILMRKEKEEETEISPAAVPAQPGLRRTSVLGAASGRRPSKLVGLSGMEGSGPEPSPPSLLEGGGLG